MGEMAEDMVDGTCCSVCGQYFQDPDDPDDSESCYTHGYPVACKSCWRYAKSTVKRTGLQRAIVNTI